MNKYINSIYHILPSRLQDSWNNIMQSDIGRRIAKGTFWTLNGSIISRVLALLSSILVARITGKVVYGEFGIVQSTIGMLGTFAGMGLGLTATKYIAEYRDIDKLKVGRIISMSYVISVFSGLLLSIILYFSASWLSSKTLAAPELAVPLKAGTLVLFISAVTGAQNGILAGFESFKKLAFINLWSGVASFPFMLLGAYFMGLNGLVIALILIQIVTLIFNVFAISNVLNSSGIFTDLKGWNKELKIIWEYSIPAILSSIVVTPVMWLGNSMLVNQKDGYSEMGLFSVANQWRMALLFLSTILTNSLLPIFSNENSNHEKFLKIFDRIHKLNTGIIFPIYLAIIMSSQFIMNLYGKSFSEGYVILITIISATAINGIGGPAGAAIQSKGKMWLAFTMNLSWGIVFWISAYYMIPLFGALGLSYAFLISYIFLTIWSYAYLRSYLTVRIFNRSLISILLIIASSLLVSFGLYMISK